MAQFMPGTAKGVATAMKLATFDVLSRPTPRVWRRITYKSCTDRSNWSKVLAAYNAGLGRVRGWSKELPRDQFLFNELIRLMKLAIPQTKTVEASLLYRFLAGERRVSSNGIVR